MTFAQTIVERAEVRREQPRGADLRRQRADAGDEDEQPETARGRTASHAANDDDRAVVLQLAAAERAAVLQHGVGELLRGRARVGDEHVVQTLDAVELAAAPRLDHAVRVEDDRVAGAERCRDLFVALAGLDPERDAARVERLDPALRTSRGGGWPADAQRTVPVAPSTSSTTIVMNLPSAISPPTTPLAAASRAPGSGCSRTSERKTYFAIAMSAAASTRAR